MLKNFQPSKQISSTIVTPKYFKFKQSDKQDKKQEEPSNPNILRSKEKSSNYSQGPSKNAPAQKQSLSTAQATQIVPNYGSSPKQGKPSN